MFELEMGKCHNFAKFPVPYGFLGMGMGMFFRKRACIGF